jgi:hypothetical protein
MTQVSFYAACYSLAHEYETLQSAPTPVYTVDVEKSVEEETVEGETSIAFDLPSLSTRYPQTRLRMTEVCLIICLEISFILSCAPSSKSPIFVVPLSLTSFT